MRNHFNKRNGASRDSQRIGRGEGNHANPLDLKLSEVVEIPKGNEFFLGSGLGFIPLDSLLRLVSFHGYLSTGAFIGLQMLSLGRRLLGIEENERIHVLCETQNCLPDPFQVLAGATIGNRGLMVRDTGKMAVTITRHTPPGERAPGVRIILDPAKTNKFDRLHAWYMNTEKVPHREVIQILREAGDTAYSYAYTEVPVTGKPKQRVATCSICGEPFVQMNEGDGPCVDCAVEEEIV